MQHGESELCDFECAGDSSQICGGYWSMTVYEYTSAETTPETEETTTSTTSSTSVEEGDGSSSSDSSTDDSSSECDGILSPLGFYCCASSCGTCGGSNCSGRSGGADACCTQNIKESGEMCENNAGAAPCIVEYVG